MSCNPCNLSEDILNCSRSTPETSSCSAYSQSRQTRGSAFASPAASSTSKPPEMRTRPCLDIGRISQISSAAGDMQKAKAAFIKDVLWENGSVIRVHFCDGDVFAHNAVSFAIKKYLEPLVNLSFRWSHEDPTITMRNGDIRISFAEKGAAYSLLGVESQYDRSRPSMNLGWLDANESTSDLPNVYAGTYQVILHEFGHAMGMIHEHNNPRNNCIVWNKEAVRAALRGPPNYWTNDIIDTNMFGTYCKDQINGSDYDPKSIMHYWFTKEWVCNPCNLKLQYNTKYSDLDKKWLSKMYPKSGDRDTSADPGDSSSSSSSSSSSWLNIPLMTILGICIVLAVVSGLYHFKMIIGPAALVSVWLPLYIISVIGTVVATIYYFIGK